MWVERLERSDVVWRRNVPFPSPQPYGAFIRARRGTHLKTPRLASCECRKASLEVYNSRIGEALAIILI